MKIVPVLLILLLTLAGCAHIENEDPAVEEQKNADRIITDVEQFPWPPPKASAFCIIPPEFLRKLEGETYLKDVLKHLETAMAKNGYMEWELRAVKFGFAIVSRAEQFKPDGSPETGKKRWETEFKPLQFAALGSKPAAYLRALFFPDVLHLRRIVLIVKPGRVNEGNYEASPEEIERILNSRMKIEKLGDIVNIPFSSNYSCTALIYEFEIYKLNEQPILISRSSLPGKIHLEKSNLWQTIKGAK
jgi:hypothetical protein